MGYMGTFLYKKEPKAIFYLLKGDYREVALTLQASFAKRSAGAQPGIGCHCSAQGSVPRSPWFSIAV